MNRHLSAEDAERLAGEAAIDVLADAEIFAPAARVQFLAVLMQCLSAERDALLLTLGGDTVQ